MLLPLGVEDQTVDRVPVVSIGIAVLCFLCFFASGRGEEQGDASPVIGYWVDHPYLALPQGLFNVPEAARERLLAKKPAPAERAVADEQAQLDSLVTAFQADRAHSPIFRFGLVPARGFGQIGWLTHMFLHGGWMHILGNLLFFYIVALLLEDAWGRLLFSGFYLLGGLVAALGQYGLDHHSQVPLVGASGAIAACMGAFAYRFGTRRIRMGYFYWVTRGTFLMPAWLWAGMWFAFQVLQLKLGIAGNVAVMAHVAGFMFGFAVAAAMSLSGFEARVLAPAVDRDKGVWTAEAPPPRRFANPRDLERSVGLAKSPEQAWELLDTAAADFPLRTLSPALLLRTATQLADSSREGLSTRVETLLVAASEAPGPVGAKALVHLAELRIADGKDAEGTRALLDQIAVRVAGPDLPPELAAAAKKLRDQLPAPVDMSLALTEPDQPTLPDDALPPHIQVCKLTGFSKEGVGLETEGGERLSVSFADIRGIAVGFVPGKPNPGQAAHRVLLTDLVLDWGGFGVAAEVLRVPGFALALDRLAPGVPAAQAYQRLLATLLERSKAQTRPALEVLRRAEYPNFGSLAEFNAGYAQG